MIKVKEILDKEKIEYGTFAIVTYNGIKEATYFSKINTFDSDWYLESPCQIMIGQKIGTDLDAFYQECIYQLLEDGADKKEYIKKYIKPMIIDNIYYTIENFQCSPYLPEYVDKIEIVSERDCLLYMLNEEYKMTIQEFDNKLSAYNITKEQFLDIVYSYNKIK